MLHKFFKQRTPFQTRVLLLLALMGTLAWTAFTFFGCPSSVGFAQDQERTGRTQQQLVGGTLVDAEVSEQNGLVTLNSAPGSCSGSHLRDNWIITAAHCVQGVADNGVTITANWRTDQTRQSMRVITFENDVALVRIADPFEGGPKEGFNRQAYTGNLAPLDITFFGRGLSQFAQVSGSTQMASQRDGLYRVGYFKTDKQDGITYSFPGGASQGAAGDSGGPSYFNGQLVGVHSNCERQCLAGKTCPLNDWTWVSGTPRCTDAAVAPDWDDIDRYLGAYVPRKQFIGTFGATPPGYQPMWVYAITRDGDLLWYRKETNAANWAGPKKVGVSWNFKDVIPAGGNSFYALTEDGKLIWYRHDGFNQGGFNWRGPVEVGSGWNFTKIFSGGEGIVYAIKSDGALLWYRNRDYANGVRSWDGPNVVGSGWASFTDVFSTGNGVIYALQPDGKLLRYVHRGYAAGTSDWVGPRNAGSGWQGYSQIVPVGPGLLLTITESGQMLLRKYNGDDRDTGPGGIGVNRWESPITIGSGWVGFKKVFAVLPAAPGPVH